MKLLAVGADPEVFLRSQQGPHSAEGLFGGTKSAPLPMKNMPEGFCIQEDNVAAEYNIPPGKTAKEFATNIARGLAYIQAVAKKHKLEVDFQSALHFPKHQLTTPHAKMLGCEPDFNVWLRQVNPRPHPPETLRTAAGHVHISIDTPTQTNQEVLVKMCDIFLGVPSILATKKNERRSLYGRAGAFRPKDYGVEYRVLDNWWLQTPKTRAEVFHFVTNAIHEYNKNPNHWHETFIEWDEEIQTCINEHDPDLSLMLIEIFGATPFSKG